MTSLFGFFIAVLDLDLDPNWIHTNKKGEKLKFTIINQNFFPVALFLYRYSSDFQDGEAHRTSAARWGH